MLDVNISDSRLASMLRHYISANARYGADKRLKGIKLCGSRVLPAPCGDGFVYVVVSEDKARYMGVAHCHSPWSCPVCSAKVMAEKGGEIATLIDARRQWEKKSAFMVTFTLPHTDAMSCEEAFQVLNDTWRMFTRDGRRAKNSQGKNLSPYGQMRAKFDIKSIVRVYEFTWGENGWHPHIHALLWTKRENFKDLLPYEDLLTDRWLHCAKYCHEKLFQRAKKDSCPSPPGSSGGFPQIGEEARMDDYDGDSCDTARIAPYGSARRRTLSNIDLNELYADYKHRPVTGHRAVYFSKTADGQVREESSAHYISGWGADSELTRGDRKKCSKFEGHYSPYEMLVKAQAAKDEADKRFWLDLYLEYVITTRGHKRVNFTPGDRKLIEKWRQTNDYIKTLKKNLTVKVKNQRAVFWFNKQQWQEILCNEHETPDLRVRILEAAIRSPSLVVSLLRRCGIDVSSNDLNCSRMRQVNEKILHAIVHQKTKAA